MSREPRMEYNDIHSGDATAEGEVRGGNVGHGLPHQCLFQDAGWGIPAPKCVFYRAIHSVINNLPLIQPKSKTSQVKCEHFKRQSVTLVAIGHSYGYAKSDERLMDRGWTDRRHMQNLFKAKRTEICPHTHSHEARLIFHAGNVTGHLCLLSSGPLAL